jgi:hypothetical protein
MKTEAKRKGSGVVLVQAVGPVSGDERVIRRKRLVGRAQAGSQVEQRSRRKCVQGKRRAKSGYTVLGGYGGQLSQTQESKKPF